MLALTQVGIMSYGRSGERSLDDPVYEGVLAATASMNAVDAHE